MTLKKNKEKNAVLIDVELFYRYYLDSLEKDIQYYGLKNVSDDEMLRENIPIATLAGNY